jgi:FkbM family methyltransferase
MTIPNGYRVQNGMIVPAADVACSKVVFKMVADLNAVYPFVKKWGTAIQAGGNFGVFPVALAEKFQSVLTFEPHPDNFFALKHNTKDLKNVIAIEAALGDEWGYTGLALASHEANNFGAFYVTPVKTTVPTEDAAIPFVRIDDFASRLEKVGLIYLDIEGFEMKALKGAIRVINEHRPIIALEDKGLSDKYGSAKGEVEKWLEYVFEYKVLARVHKDVVLGPKH